MTRPRLTKDWTLDELTGALCAASHTQEYINAKAELSRRQFEGQMETSRYQIMAAEAEVKAANAATLAAEAAVKGTQAAERNAKYMLASVIVAAIAAIASAISAFATVHPFR
jgi:acetoin utilization deacetylase AcuC-like enzyme